ncbi:unnamed protein product [Schistosoma curassoni]|uniref:COPIIcoated_ERV domain-containing protein n=1 Tax=Schistosoma curassoni TaxID=6186 RepID=A0A183KYW5_9TREM|nr:unnamed protein product [Schistosoma curassoni]
MSGLNMFYVTPVSLKSVVGPMIQSTRFLYDLQMVNGHPLH